MGARIVQLLVIIFIQIWITTAQNNDQVVRGQRWCTRILSLLYRLCVVNAGAPGSFSLQGFIGVSLQSLKAEWRNTRLNWDDSSDPCGGGWVGITCIKSRVTTINLASMQLKGKLTGDIGHLTELKFLDLSYNEGLTGSLTTAIGNLKNLANLTIVGCSFNGPIPDEIGNLQSLESLSLNSNGFTGSIPASIGNLKNLYWLDLSNNTLTGRMPVSSGGTPGLDMLTLARHFHLGDNQLSGDIPPQLFSSNMKLIHLLFENNNFTGSIPSTLGLVQSLEVVRLDRNFLSGDVPSNINNLTSMNDMYLSNNQLTGPVPNLTGMKVLNYLDLSNNNFDQSDIPSWFSTLESLTTLNMRSTNIGGELPAALFSIPQLQTVDLSNNRLNGTLNISSNPSNQLQLVNLQTNRIADFTQRREYSIVLILVDNPICMESGVTDRYCSPPTKTNGSSYSTPANNCVPPSCGSGLVSSPNCSCAYPYSGYFSFKAPSFSNLENSTIYDSLHDSLMMFFRTAQLPVDSVSLKNPYRNAEDYLQIYLEVFPSGEPNFNRIVIGGIGSAFSSQTFKPSNYFNTYVFHAVDYDFSLGHKHRSSKIGVIIGSTVGGCVLVILLVYAFRQKGQAARAAQQSHPFALWDPTSGNGGVPQLKGARSFTFEEIKKYTSSFAEINNIGAGGYGMVYRGSLPNGELIAIKRAQQGSTQGGLEFKTEIELLSRVHHKNVVGLIGFCFDKGEQMLVYEYIVNGTLKDSLSGRSSIRLDWMRRLQIALGAARGLQYLHDLADPPIIHRDVKTTNILLDKRLVAKVADFGISKPLSDANSTHVTTQVKGTMGYMDPQYFMTQQLTEKSDVYSFGVVMLELITARNPIEKGKYIVTEVKQAMNKSKELYDLHEVLDPTIGLRGQLKGLERFVDLSLGCVEETGNQRPTMSEVVRELESILELVGLNPGIESSSSTSTSYERTGNYYYNHPYSNDHLFAYSGSFLSSKLQSK